MKQVRLIKITSHSRKIVTMQESIWNTILKDNSMLPHGVTYELAPKDEMKAIELIETSQPTPIEDVEPIQVFTPEMVEESKAELIEMANEEVKKVAPKKAIKPTKKRK
jgi:hypothetical protein